MTTDRIKPMAIEQEMKNSFLDYSMSVIVSRAHSIARSMSQLQFDVVVVVTLLVQQG